MNYHDRFTPGCTFRLSIAQEDKTLLDVVVTAEGEAEAISRAKRSIQRLLNEHTPKIEQAAISIPAETAMEKAEEPQGPEEQAPTGCGDPAFNSGAKGVLNLKCPECMSNFHICLRDYQRSVPCKCGHVIDLTDPTIARYEYNCPSCGRHNYGKTNIEDPEYTDTCQCGENIRLVWNKVRKRYTN